MRTPAPPHYWLMLVCIFLRAPERLAQELYALHHRVFPQSGQALRYQLEQCSHLADVQHPVIAQQRLDQLRQLLPPQELLTLTAQLSPEGRPRRRDVVALEEAILSYADATGAWR